MKVNRPISVKQQRMSAFVQKTLADLIMQGDFFTSGEIVTVAGVSVSPDLRHAKVFISVLNGSLSQVLRRLENERQDLQNELFRAARARAVPAIVFSGDDSAAYAEHIDDLLRLTHDSDPSRHDE